MELNMDTIEKLNKCVRMVMSTAEYYDEYSDVYLSDYGSVFQAALFAEDPVEHCRVMMGRGMILPGHRVLDVGCGVGGVMSGLMANGVEDIVGVTNSVRQVELAKVDLELADFMEWEDAGRTFDRVILCESFGYFEEPGKLIAKCVGLLKPGGMIYVKDLCAVSDPDLVQQVGLAELKTLWNYENYTVGEMVWLWAQAGMRRVGGDDNLWRISDCVGFVKFISGDSQLGKMHYPAVGQVPVKASDFLFTK
jgi:2-polyprenyl-3-methyl-5-hydroxy-6-metoxy-1,4-benzoquinol methylase